jgi:hypothetical protein
MAANPNVARCVCCDTIYQAHRLLFGHWCWPCWRSNPVKELARALDRFRYHERRANEWQERL